MQKKILNCLAQGVDHVGIVKDSYIIVLMGVNFVWVCTDLYMDSALHNQNNYLSFSLFTFCNFGDLQL